MYIYLDQEITQEERKVINDFCKLFNLKFKNKCDSRMGTIYTFYFSDYSTISYPSISSMIDAINKENNKYD